MHKKVLYRLFVCAVVVPLTIGLLATNVHAQQKKAAAKKKVAAKKKPAKPRGRLPNYYTKVVSPQQRKLIYSIQGKYAEQIAKLQKELDALKAKMNAEVAAVLTSEQKAEVEKLRAAAAAKRKKPAPKKKAKAKPAAK